MIIYFNTITTTIINIMSSQQQQQEQALYSKKIVKSYFENAFPVHEWIISCGNLDSVFGRVVSMVVMVVKWNDDDDEIYIFIVYNHEM